MRSFVTATSIGGGRRGTRYVIERSTPSLLCVVYRVLWVCVQDPLLSFGSHFGSRPMTSNETRGVAFDMCFRFACGCPPLQ